MNTYRVDQTWQQMLVFDVRRKAFIEGQHIPLELEFDEIYGERYNYVLIEEKGVGIGTARINFEHPDYAKIERVAIIPENQKKGFGRQLIAACEDWIKDCGIYSCVITSQTQAAQFYEKNGYKVNKEIEITSSIPQVYMEKHLIRS